MKIKNKKFEIEFIGDTQLKKFLRASKDRLKKLSEYFQILHQNEDQTMITIKIVSNEEIKILNKKFRKRIKLPMFFLFPMNMLLAILQSRIVISLIKTKQLMLRIFLC